MTLFFVLQKKCRVVFDSNEEKMEIEPVDSTDLGVSSLVEEDGSGEREIL